MSSNWFSVVKQGVEICPRKTVFLMKWQSTSICLVHSWKVGLFGRKVAVLLSQYIGISLLTCIPRSLSRDCTNRSSQAIYAIALYFDSAPEWETTFCFLLSHLTRVPTNKDTETSSKSCLQKNKHNLNMRNNELEIGHYFVKQIHFLEMTKDASEYDT